MKTKVQTDRENASYASTEVKVLKANHFLSPSLSSFFYVSFAFKRAKLNAEGSFAVLRIQMAISL